MKLTGFLKNISRNYSNDKINITLEINEEYEFRKINTEDIKDKLLDINLIQHKRKRSNNTNKYMWQLITKLAQKRDKSTSEIYMEMLERYGKNFNVVIAKENIDTALQMFKYCKVLGEIKAGTGQALKVKVFLGTSEYNPTDMYYFVQGIIKECNKEKIDTLTPNEIERIKEMLKIC